MEHACNTVCLRPFWFFFAACFSTISKIFLHLSVIISSVAFYVSYLLLVRVLTHEIDGNGGGNSGDGAGGASRCMTPEILGFNCTSDISGRKVLMDRIRGGAAPSAATCAHGQQGGCLIEHSVAPT